MEGYLMESYLMGSYCLLGSYLRDAGSGLMGVAPAGGSA